MLRGFAILGIFIANLNAYTFNWALTEDQKSTMLLHSYDGQMEFFHTMLITGKFYSIFSLLFGIGFAIYLSKADQNNNILKLFKRRLLVLLLIGFLHLLIWTGDIVAFYAILGFLLIPLRKFSNKVLLILAAVCILIPIGLYALQMANPKIFNIAQWPAKLAIHLDSKIGIDSNESYYKVGAGNNFWMMLRANLHGIFWRYHDLIFESRAFKVIGMFLLGVVVGRTKIFANLNNHKKLFWTVAIAGFAIGIPLNYFYADMKGPEYYQLMIEGLYKTILYSFGVAPLALAYVASICLLYLKKSFKSTLDLIAPAGRMALTNYIMHSVIGLFTFTKLGLGIDNYGPTAFTIFALVIFTFQIIFSTIWLRYFNYGPLEWLWRSATYRKWQKMRKQ